MYKTLNEIPEENRMEAILTYIDNQVDDATFSSFLEEIDIESEADLHIDDALKYIENQKCDDAFIDFLQEFKKNLK